MDKIMEQKHGWEIIKIEKSERNGKYYVHGINHETTDELFRCFHWHIIDVNLNTKYWFSKDCEISESVIELLKKDLTSL
jgi:hypothetical protein